MSCIHYTSATSAARTTPHCLLYSPIFFTEFHWTSPSRYCREHRSPATHRVGSRQVGTCWDPCRITTCWCHDIYHYISLFDIDPRCDLAWEDCVDPLPLPIGASTCGDRLFPVAHARDAMRLMRSKIQHSKAKTTPGLIHSTPGSNNETWSDLHFDSGLSFVLFHLFAFAFFVDLFFSYHHI